MGCCVDEQGGQELSQSQRANTKVCGRGAGADGGNEQGEKQIKAKIFGGGINTVW